MSAGKRPFATYALGEMISRRKNGSRQGHKLRVR
jgi:hypothetical protein